MPQVTVFQPLEIDPGTVSWVAGHVDRRWAIFLDYWQNLAARLRRVPARRDLDPIEMSAALLPNLFLIDILPADQVVARTRFRFRLLGAEITAREKVRTGTYLDELASADELANIERQYHEAMAMRIYMRATTLIWEARVKDHVAYKVIMLPLLGDQAASGHGTIAHLIGCVVYEDERRTI